MNATVTVVDHEYEKAKTGRLTVYNYTPSKVFCHELGLKWLDGMLAAVDRDAWLNGFTQEQVDIAMRHHLWQVRYLFDPKIYSFKQRIILALYFLVGWKL